MAEQLIQIKATQKVFVEGYGCSANLAETEQIKGYLKGNSTKLVETPSDAELIIVHSCGVKKATEFKMKRRVAKLKQLNSTAQIVVSGCLPKINPHAIAQEQRVIQIGTRLEELGKIAGLAQQPFSHSIPEERINPFVSILPIATGCLSACSFCGTKKAKGVLDSYPIGRINERFSRDQKNGTKEFWLVSQDNGCYGFDRKTNLAKLVETLLSNEGEFRIRIGMMSPQYLRDFYGEFTELFKDERVYRFVHLPAQSGNNRILGLMRRQYSVEEFEKLVSDLRKDIKDLSVSTDIIAGFPTETKQEFLDSVRLIEKIKFDTVNISKFAVRPETGAERLPQLSEKEKSRRSHILTRVCRNVFLQKNKELVGRKEKILVVEKAKINGFAGRTNSYKNVFVPNAELNEFAYATIEEAFPNFLKGTIC